MIEISACPTLDKTETALVGMAEYQSGGAVAVSTLRRKSLGSAVSSLRTELGMALVKATYASLYADPVVTELRYFSTSLTAWVSCDVD